jgi:hypothetical protein
MPANSGPAYPGEARSPSAPHAVSAVPVSATPVVAADLTETSDAPSAENGLENANPIAGASTAGPAAGDVSDSKPADTNPTTTVKPAPEDPARPRTFVVEGPGEALRVGFDDLDLMKLINMDPVTSDCIEKMPGWLRDLNGKPVRIRGYMKPSGQSEGIPEFVFVRSTDLCCFGPKGKVYHLIAVKLKAGTTTDYIELKPFDVTGRFRIEKVELDDGLIFLLYHIDDAAIIRK